MKAPFAARDADAFKAHVRALGVPERNIVLIKGAKAGRASIVKNVEQWLPRLAKPDSRVYFYFSGHGAPDVKTGHAAALPKKKGVTDVSLDFGALPGGAMGSLGARF